MFLIFASSRLCEKMNHPLCFQERAGERLSQISPLLIGEGAEGEVKKPTLISPQSSSSYQ